MNKKQDCGDGKGRNCTPSGSCFKEDGDQHENVKIRAGERLKIFRAMKMCSFRKDLYLGNIGGTDGGVWNKILGCEEEKQSKFGVI